VKSLDVAAARVTAFVDVNTSAVHAESPNSRNVIVPVGRSPPTRLAVSRTRAPTGPPTDGDARIAGHSFEMARVKVWQARAPESLTAQTVVGPKDPAVVGAPVTKPEDWTTTPGGRLPAVTTKVGLVRSELALNWWRYPFPTIPGGGGALVMTGEVWATAAGPPHTNAAIPAAMATNGRSLRCICALDGSYSVPSRRFVRIGPSLERQVHSL
jgi:hypothetical protein